MKYKTGRFIDKISRHKKHEALPSCDITKKIESF
jgi:hypothetical protein